MGNCFSSLFSCITAPFKVFFSCFTGIFKTTGKCCTGSAYLVILGIALFAVSMILGFIRKQKTKNAKADMELKTQQTVLEDKLRKQDDIKESDLFK